MVGRRNPPGIFKTDTMARRITVYIYIQFRRFVRLVSPRINVWGARGEEERKDETRAKNEMLVLLQIHCYTGVRREVV